MRGIFRFAAGLGALGAIALCGEARAQSFDFNLTKNVAAGTLTLTDTNANYGVTELVVGGFGSSAGTTLPGWSAAAMLFSDPLNCQPAIGSTITSGFCYILSDTTVGSPIGATSVTFTYDSSFDDQTIPSEFAVVFTGNLSTTACFGETGSGCNATLAPEPASGGVFLTALAGLLGLAGWRRVRMGA